MIFPFNQPSSIISELQIHARLVNNRGDTSTRLPRRKDSGGDRVVAARTDPLTTFRASVIARGRANNDPTLQRGKSER